VSLCRAKLRWRGSGAARWARVRLLPAAGRTGISRRAVRLHATSVRVVLCAAVGGCSCVPRRDRHLDQRERYPLWRRDGLAAVPQLVESSRGGGCILARVDQHADRHPTVPHFQHLMQRRDTLLPGAGKSQGEQISGRVGGRNVPGS
jgi:hypothetical protein